MFKEYLEEYILDCKIRNLSYETIKMYKLNIGLFKRWLEKSNTFEIECLKKNDFKKYILFLKNKNYKVSYINTILKCLKAFFLYLMEEEYISNNPMENIKMLKEEKIIVETFTDMEIKELINCVKEKDFMSIRNRLIIEILADTGIRCSELRGLKNDYVFESYIKIKGKGNKWRVIPISTYLQKRILIYRRTKEIHFKNKNISNEYFFVGNSGKYISTNVSIEIIIKTISKKCNIRSHIRCSPHTFRHYYAKTSIKNGQDLFTLSKLLGHSNVKITQRYLESMHDDELIIKGSFSSPLKDL